MLEGFDDVVLCHDTDLGLIDQHLFFGLYSVLSLSDDRNQKIKKDNHHEPDNAHPHEPADEHHDRSSIKVFVQSVLPVSVNRHGFITKTVPKHLDGKSSVVEHIWILLCRE